MKKLLLVLSAAAFSIAGAQTVTSSRITWKAYKTLHTDAFSHYGTIKLKAGNFVQNSAGEVVGGNFVADMSAITADDEKGKMKDMLERHLKSDDFFDVAKYPTAFFKLTAVKRNQGKYNSIITGNLTIKGITRQLSFPANITKNGGTLSVDSAVFTFNRHDFDLRYDTFEDMAISNNVEVQVHAEAK